MAEDSGQEKTESPTAKKRSDARKDGSVAKTVEVNSVFVLLTAIFLLRVMGAGMLRDINDFIKHCFELTAITDMSDLRLMEIAGESIAFLIKIILPFAAAIMVAGIVANIIQVGFMFTTKPLMPKFSKINPLKGLKQKFSLTTVVEAVKSILKVIIIGYVAYVSVKGEYELLVMLADTSVMAIWNFITEATFNIFVRIALVLLAIALLDFSYKRYEHEKKLKMTKQEIKDESKQMEGSPEVKGRIRSLQREMARRRMMGEVPKATVVVTNPTHIAIALLYESEKNDAPVVVAKGKQLIAQQIKKIAAEHGVPMVEDKPLARAMYDKIEVGFPIPAEFFTAVAEIMAYVFKLKNKSAA
ncbi:MAG: flagellar biosynthesis protein FlhB [Chitinispirillales bacterium]|jgi:flagellar biosynthetic protein FlhB|nr:flagellar biosynthesis protein FlhB [Chitinispirillales bacterium]